MASFNGSNNHELTPDSPTDDVTENCIIVNSKPFNPEIPVPPPDIPLDWIGYEYQTESMVVLDYSAASESVTEEEKPRQALLNNIRAGTQLRSVPVQVCTYITYIHAVNAVNTVEPAITDTLYSGHL